MSVNLLAPINSLGYGVVGFNILKSLIKLEQRVSLFPIAPLRDEDVRGYAKDIDVIRQGMKNAQLYDEKAPSVRIWHQHELDKFVGRGDRIGWPIFELDKFTDQEKHQLYHVDRLFVCSEWAKNVVEDNGILTPVDVVPLGFDPDVFYLDTAAIKTRPYYTCDTTVFLNVGKWEGRKGHNELVEAFSKAFTLNDDVELWMMNDNPFLGAQGNEVWKRKYMSSPMGAKIKILERVPTQDDMRTLFNHVDFGVFPSHAEGWNLEILELMACGVPCIATNYSGHTEFLTKDNSLLVEPTGMESAQDGVWFHGQGDWCSFSVDDLVDQMRVAHALKQADVRGEISGGLGNLKFKALNTAKEFTWDKAVEKMIEVL
jgi:glycosyltransferase involved in cell wall biosynthesis